MSHHKYIVAIAAFLITTAVAAAGLENRQLADMAAETIKMNQGISGKPEDVAIADLTEEATPSAGDMLVGFNSLGAIKKFDVNGLSDGNGIYTANGTLPTGNNRVFTLEGTSQFQIQGAGSSELFVGTTEASIISGAGSYKSTVNGLEMNFGAAKDLLINSSSGTSGQVLSSSGADLPPTWQDGLSAADVTANDQVAVWTGDGTLEGGASFTFSGTELNVTAPSDPVISLTGTSENETWRMWVDQTDDNFTIDVTTTGGTVVPFEIEQSVVDNLINVGTLIDASRVEINGNLKMSGAITTTSTVDGRDVALDGTNQDNHIATPNHTVDTNASSVCDTGEVLGGAADGCIAAGSGGSGGGNLTTKGDLEAYDTAQTRLPVGADNYILTADSTAAAGVEWKASSNRGISVTLSGTQSITAGVQAKVAFVTEEWDIDNEHVSGTYTAKKAGYIEASGQLTFNVAADGDQLNVFIKVNGVNVSNSTAQASDANNQVVPFKKLLNLAINDTVEIHVQNANNNDTLQSSSDGTFWQMIQ